MVQDKSKKTSGITALSIKVGDLVTSAYKGARVEDGSRMTQDDLSDRAGIPLTTLQKKLNGKAPISTTDLVLLATAIPHTSPGAILDEAVAQLSEEQGKNNVTEVDFEGRFRRGEIAGAAEQLDTSEDDEGNDT